VLVSMKSEHVGLALLVGTFAGAGGFLSFS